MPMNQVHRGSMEQPTQPPDDRQARHPGTRHREPDWLHSSFSRSQANPPPPPNFSRGGTRVEGTTNPATGWQTLLTTNSTGNGHLVDITPDPQTRTAIYRVVVP